MLPVELQKWPPSVLHSKPLEWQGHVRGLRDEFGRKTSGEVLWLISREERQTMAVALQVIDKLEVTL